MYASLRIVDLPEPLGPVRKANSPLRRWNVMWLSATPVRGYSLPTPWNLIISGKRLGEIRDEVLDVLDADAQPHEAIRNSHRGALFGSHARVRGEARLDHERVDTAQARRVSE